MYEAISRILHPEHSDAQGMMIFAIFGMLINGYAAWQVSGGKSLNEKVVAWHLLEDVLGWFAILIASIILQFKDIVYLDPILSLLITSYILWGVFKRLKETLFVFLQGTPSDIDLNEIEKKIKAVKRVKSTHHTRIWSLEGENHVFTTHVKLQNISEFSEIISVKKEIKEILKTYHLDQNTIETELDNESCSI